MNKMIAVDSNIILYALDENESNFKKEMSLEIMRDKLFFSSQSLSEVINVCRKRWKYDKTRLIKTSVFLLKNCRLIPVSEMIVNQAHTVSVKYDLQYFDSLIIASALEANCKILYSEDMQHNLLVENQLRIINPFL
jgi:predicted nucleic acid-binding protein